MCSSSGGQKLYDTVSGIITPIGDRTVHRLRANSYILEQVVEGISNEVGWLHDSEMLPCGQYSKFIIFTTALRIM